MTKRTHIALGVVSILPLINQIYIPVGLIETVFLDYDYKVGLKYIVITHILLSLILTTGLMLNISPHLAIIWSICYLSHLVGDSITKTGIPPLSQ